MPGLASDQDSDHRPYPQSAMKRDSRSAKNGPVFVDLLPAAGEARRGRLIVTSGSPYSPRAATISGFGTAGVASRSESHCSSEPERQSPGACTFLRNPPQLAHNPPTC